MMKSRKHNQMMIARLFSIIATEVFTERYTFRDTYFLLVLYILIHFRTAITCIEFLT